MNITENVYQCSSCRRQHADSLAALACHRRGFIRKPIPLTVYDLDHPSLLVVATAVTAGLHHN